MEFLILDVEGHSMFNCLTVFPNLCNFFFLASHYCVRFGFQPYAYKGLETGERKVACHAVKQNNTIFVFKSR